MDLVQTYGISRSHLNHRRQIVIIKLQTYSTSSDHVNYRRQLLRWLHSRDRCGTKYIRHSLAVPRDRTSSQIAIILVQPYGISRSYLNHRHQLLIRLHSRDGCGNITYQTSSFNPSSMFEESDAMVLFQIYGIFRSHLDHRTSTLHGIDNVPKVKNFSIKRGGKLFLRSDVFDILVCTTIVVGSNRAQQLQATSYMCSVKLLKKRCRLVLIDVSTSNRCMGWLPGMMI